VEDPNTMDYVREIYSYKFQIIVTWDMEFVKICNLSKNLNKDCDLGMKPFYKENLAHARKLGMLTNGHVQTWMLLFDILTNITYSKDHIMLCNIPLFLLLLLILLIVLYVT
jgi:hypothetical protein